MRPCSSHRLHWSVVALHGPPTSIIRGSDICFVQLSALDRCNWERLPCHRYTLPKYFYNNRDRVSRDLTKELYFLFFFNYYIQQIYDFFLLLFRTKIYILLDIQYFQILVWNNQKLKLKFPTRKLRAEGEGGFFRDP